MLCQALASRNLSLITAPVCQMPHTRWANYGFFSRWLAKSTQTRQVNHSFAKWLVSRVEGDGFSVQNAPKGATVRLFSRDQNSQGKGRPQRVVLAQNPNSGEFDLDLALAMA